MLPPTLARSHPQTSRAAHAACAAPQRASNPASERSSAQVPRRLSFGGVENMEEGELKAAWGASPARERRPAGGCAAPARPCRPEPLEHAGNDAAVRALHFYGGGAAQGYGSPVAAAPAAVPGAPLAVRVLARWPSAVEGTQLMF